MKCRYSIIKSRVLIDGNKYISYGIKSRKGLRTVNSFRDISLNINDVKKLCALLNDSNISEVHFYDIIEDFLAK
jgi:hypothetical protein